MKRLVLVFVALMAVACGSDSPVAPTPPPAPVAASVAGNYTGTWQATQTNGGPYLIAYTMVLNQSVGSVTGTWATAQANGTVTGTTTPSSFSGTFAWNGTTVNGSACTGSFAVAGPAGGNTITWTSPAVTGNCTNLPTAVTIAAQLR